MSFTLFLIGVSIGILSTFVYFYNKYRHPNKQDKAHQKRFEQSQNTKPWS